MTNSLTVNEARSIGQAAARSQMRFRVLVDIDVTERYHVVAVD
jgi:hypothetical protein